MLRRIYMRIAYDGTDFHGWQRQRGVRTVQEELEGTLQRVMRHPVDLIGSGRTDAGVHAIGHVDSFATDHDMPAERMQRAIQARLPLDISIIEVRDVHPAFHATRSALSKLYRYRIYNALARPVEEFVQRYTYHFWAGLDVDRMQAAAHHFVGKMDFTSLTPKRTVRETMVRTVMRCDVARCGNEVHIDVEGDGFLHNQVRNIAGTLIEVGRGHWEPDRIVPILESRDRNEAGPTAPALGLCLQWVRYPEELLDPNSNIDPPFEQ